MNVPFFKPHITGNEGEYVQEAINSGNWSYGEYSNELEGRFIELSGKKYCLAVVNASTAFELVFQAYRELSCSPGTINIPKLNFYTPSIQWPGVLNAMYRHGDINFLDINPDTWNVSLRKQDIEKGSVVVPVDLHGRLFDGLESVDTQNTRDVFIVSDCAQSLGAKYHYDDKVIRYNRNHPAGFFANVSIFSLYATKSLSAGEGGMICTDDEGIYERCRMLSNHGMFQHSDITKNMKREVAIAGYKSRMSNIHAAVALAQLEVFDELLENRKRIWNLYQEFFYSKNENDMLGFKLPWDVNHDCEHNYHIYGIVFDYVRFKENKQHNTNNFTLLFRNMMQANEIGTSIQFSAAHKHPFIYSPKRQRNSLSVSNWYHNGAVSLPLYPNMTEGEIEYVCKNVIRISKELQ